MPVAPKFQGPSSGGGSAVPLTPSMQEEESSLLAPVHTWGDDEPDEPTPRGAEGAVEVDDDYLFGGPEEPDEEPEPEPKPARDDDAIQRRLDALEAENRRLREQPAPAQPAFDPNQIGDALAQGLARFSQQHAPQPAPPAFPEIDAEEAMTNPKAFRDAIRKAAEWGAAQVEHKAGPLLRNLEGGYRHLLAETNASRPAREAIARSEAARLAVANGLAADDAEAQELVESAVRDVVDRHPSGAQYRMDPNAIYSAAQYHAMNSGGSLPTRRRSPKNVSNKGDQRPTRDSAVQAKAKGAAAWASKALGGVKIDPKLVERELRQNGRAR